MVIVDPSSYTLDQVQATGPVMQRQEVFIEPNVSLNEYQGQTGFRIPQAALMTQNSFLCYKEKYSELRLVVVKPEAIDVPAFVDVGDSQVNLGIRGWAHPFQSYRIIQGTTIVDESLSPKDTEHISDYGRNNTTAYPFTSLVTLEVPAQNKKTGDDSTRKLNICGRKTFSSHNITFDAETSWVANTKILTVYYLKNVERIVRVPLGNLSDFFRQPLIDTSVMASPLQLDFTFNSGVGTHSNPDIFVKVGDSLVQETYFNLTARKITDLHLELAVGTHRSEALDLPDRWYFNKISYQNGKPTVFGINGAEAEQTREFVPTNKSSVVALGVSLKDPSVKLGNFQVQIGHGGAHKIPYTKPYDQISQMDHSTNLALGALPGWGWSESTPTSGSVVAVTTRGCSTEESVNMVGDGYNILQADGSQIMFDYKCIGSAYWCSPHYLPTLDYDTVGEGLELFNALNNLIIVARAPGHPNGAALTVLPVYFVISEHMAQIVNNYVTVTDVIGGITPR